MLGRFWLCGQRAGTYRSPTLLSRIFILIAAIALGLPLAEACRYSVRDVGFADLGNERYTLLFYVEDPETPDAAGALGQAARTLLGDSNVIFEVAKREPGREGLVLVSPDGKRSHSIAWPGLEAGAGEPEWDLAQSIIASPTRDALLEKLIPAYAVVLLVDGTDAAQTKRAHTAAVEAIEAITKLMPEMPKPVEHPPVVVRLPVDRMAEETILLWSLGLDTSPTPEPQAVVVMGRGRRVGESMRGGLITRTALQEAMAVVGQDCECGLDRVWMQGERFPLAWGRAEKQAAFAELGFDPDNPKVKAEISRIIARGPNSRPSGKPQSASDNFDQLALGYSEEIIGIEEPMEEIAMVTTEQPAVTPQPTLTPEPAAAKTEPAVEEPTGSNPLAWTVALIAVVALGGGGIVLLRRGS